MSSQAFIAPLLALTAGIAVIFPLALWRDSITREDGLVEAASAALFVISAVVASGRAAFGSLSQTDRVLSVLIAPFALLLALSEISFGARMGWSKPPEMYGGGEFDGGHDIVVLSLRLVRDFPQIAVPVAFACVIASVLAAPGLLRRLKAARWVAAVEFTPMMQRFAFTLSVLAAALLLDLSSSVRASHLEEVLELMAGVMLCMTSMAVVQSKSNAAYKKHAL